MRCQQDQLYDAERQVDVGARFTSVAQIQEYLDRMRDTTWWERDYSRVFRVEAFRRPKNMGQSVGAFDRERNAGTIEMLEVHWTERDVIHELAHVLASYRYRSQAHCPWFARTYLELVYNVMGSDAYIDLYREFRIADIEVAVGDKPQGVIIA